MQREILFRGKRVDNGEWVCGNLFKNKNDYYISPEIEPFGESAQYPKNGKPEHFYAFDNFVKIYSETVGQYTGLTDKNGAKIFEGDIVKFKRFNESHLGKIVYNKKTCGFEIWYTSTVGAFGEKAIHKMYLCHADRIEIIGNIHDNPELLEVSE